MHLLDMGEKTNTYIVVLRSETQEQKLNLIWRPTCSQKHVIDASIYYSLSVSLEYVLKCLLSDSLFFYNRRAANTTSTVTYLL